MIFALFFIYFIAIVLIGFFNKKFQLGFKTDLAHFISYNLLNSLFALVYFFISTRFRIQMNMITFLYSVALAFIVFTNLTFALLALSRVTISLSDIIKSSGSTILSALFGLIFLNEQFSLRLLISLIFMLSAILIPYKSIRDSGKKNNLLVCIGFFLITGISVIIQKLYAVTPGVCDVNSFFLMTNVLLAILCGTSLLILFIARPECRHVILHPFSLKQSGVLALSTILTNISTVIGITLMARMDISVYSVISASLSILSGVLLSKVFFKERVSVAGWLSVICAICAITVSP